MAKLHDASILTGPDIAGGAYVFPEGRTGDDHPYKPTHHLSASLDPLDVVRSDPDFLSLGDLVTLNSAEYRISGISRALMYTEFAAPNGITGRDIEALVLSLAGTADASATARLWLPYDGAVVDWSEEPGKTVKFIFIGPTEPLRQVPWRSLDDDDDFRIDVTCFATGTLIETGDGPRPVHLLRVGDLVRTRDHGLQPLRWLGGRRLSAAGLAANPSLNPIRIAAGALGPGMPLRDLVLSPQHRILVRSAIAERMTGSTEVLIAAVHLVGHPGIERVPAEDGIGYWHLMFDRHEIVFAEGAEAESLYLGPMAVASMTGGALRELRALFPDLVDPGQGDPPPTARPVMRGKPVAKLIERQVRNFKPLVSALA
ncbi:Hint domain-containing protein [Paracoccus sp. (in: a-proteobacteria)]|uniref:Hint domain-containing protein n=1 Tax=Paracoccus sp. TaxID=267 RepID=UPI0026DEC7FB|nr:Hint domain-containing protein [Paracoccus sp. (in: a-proteobacteria)]MDO5369385.1 Hint domain-containing protein [Paracoccus sp. (in: a-proteobacteria)]